MSTQREMESNGVTLKAARAVDPVESDAHFVKMQETLRRPPLPEPALYDSVMRKGRRSLAAFNTAEASASESASQEDARIAKMEEPPISNATVIAALEAWIPFSPKVKKEK